MYANDAPWNDPDPDSTEPKTMRFISLKEKRFGRNSIWWVAFIHAASIYGMIVGGHWIAYVLCGSTLVVIWIASYIDWRALTKIDHGHPNGHHVMLFDASPWVCMHGVKPHKITKVCAWPIGHAEGTPEPTEEQRRIRNYPRP